MDNLFFRAQLRCPYCKHRIAYKLFFVSHYRCGNCKKEIRVAFWYQTVGFGIMGLVFFLSWSVLGIFYGLLLWILTLILLLIFPRLVVS
jgi:DNA-directed RNA polymerase subunit RPC12/RpoP